MTSSEKPQGLTAARIVIYALAAFLIAVLQTSRLGNIGFFGVRPQLMLALVCAAAYFCGSATGAVCGIMGGALTDALGGTGISILALLYMLIGYLIGAHTADRRTNRSSGRLGGWSIALAVGSGGGIIITLIGLFLGAGRPNLLLAMWHIALPEALNTYLFGWLVGVLHLAVQAAKKTRN